MTRKLQLAVKRCFDILVSLLVLVPFLPVWAVIALLIKVTSPGPVFFLQDRPGKDAKIFKVYKFRTMRPGSEKMVKGVEVMKDDDRVTSIGRFLRRSKLDEIPQCLNVLKGQMSLIGPRPERVENVEAYSREFPEWHYRERVKAGLTGYAQIFGKYNTTPEDKLRLDLMYIENYSLLLDLKLMILTIRILFSKESTEGVDKAAENQKLADELLKELDQDN